MKAPQKLALLLLALSAAALPAAAEVRDLELGDPAGTSQISLPIVAPVARLADGSFAIAWAAGASLQQPALQWVRPDGSQVFPPGGLVLPRKLSNAVSPVVAAHPTAGAFVAFQAHTSRGTQIFVQSFDGDAQPRWDAAGVLALDSPAITDQLYPQLLPSADGGVFVCFLASDGSAAFTPVCQRLDPEGRPLWPGGRRAGARAGQIDALSLVSDPQGGVLVFWTREQTRLAGNDADVTLALEGQRLSPDGTPLWGATAERFDLSPLDRSTGLFTRLAAVSDGQGGAILAYGHQAGRLRNPVVTVRAQRVDRRGGRLWGEGTTLAYGRLTLPAIDSLTLAPDGGAFAVVYETLANSQSRLVLHRVDARGRLPRPVAGTVLSAPGRIQADFNSRASFDGGRLRVLWLSHRLGDPLDLEVRIALFDAAGKRLSAPDNSPLATGSADAGPLFAGFAFDPGRDQGLAVWSLLRNPLPPVAAGALFSGDTGLP